MPKKITKGGLKTAIHHSQILGNSKHPLSEVPSTELITKWAQTIFTVKENIERKEKRPSNKVLSLQDEDNSPK